MWTRMYVDGEEGEIEEEQGKSPNPVDLKVDHIFMDMIVLLVSTIVFKQNRWTISNVPRIRNSQ